MTLQEQITSDLAVFFDTDEFAETVSYNGSDIPAIIEYGGPGAGGPAKTAVIEVKVSDVANPSYRDTVVISGDTWHVYRIQSQGVYIKGDNYTWQIPIKRDSRPTF